MNVIVAFDNFRNRCVQRDWLAGEEQGPIERHGRRAVQERQQRLAQRDVQRILGRRHRR